MGMGQIITTQNWQLTIQNVQFCNWNAAQTWPIPTQQPCAHRTPGGCLELSVYLWCALPLPPHLPTQSSFLELFEKKLWKENGTRKVGIHDLTIQSSQLQVFEKKQRKENGMRKIESTILPFKIQSCRFLNRKLWKEKERIKVGVLDLTIQSLFLQLLEKETWKEQIEIRRVWKGKEKNTHFEHPGVDFGIFYLLVGGPEI